MPKDIPVDFRIELLRDNPNNVCPLGSKGTDLHICNIKLWPYISVLVVNCGISNTNVFEIP